jgi:hypothetical protein
MSKPTNGGKRWMSFTFESAPSMFDWPAKMKTRSVFVSAQKAATGASNRAARSVMRCFMLFDPDEFR